MLRFKKKERKTIGIPTASLPDIIFILLFFFMTTSVMKENQTKLSQELVEVESLSEIKEKGLFWEVFIGANEKGKVELQLENKVVSVAVLQHKVNALMISANTTEKEDFTIRLKVDKETPYSFVSEVKEMLREEGVHHLVYAFKTAKK